MSEVEHYLTRATRGLFGRRKAEVRAELEEHLLERAWAYEVRGHTKDEALSLALRALGRPQVVSAGMNGVYTMPRVVGSTLLLAGLASLAITSWSPSTAQVAALNRFTVMVKEKECPKPPDGIGPRALETLRRVCAELSRIRAEQEASRLSGSPPTSYLSLPSLREALARLGVGVKPAGEAVQLAFPGGRAFLITPSVVAGGARYIETSSFLRVVAFEAGLPVSLTGLTNPRLTVGKVSFTLGTAAAPLDARDLYLEALSGLVYDRQGLAASALGWPTLVDPRNHPHALRVSAPKGTVFAALVRRETGFLVLDLAEVGEGGRLTFTLPREKLSFTTDPRALSPYLSGRRAKALLVRLTGRLDGNAPSYELVLPRPTTSDAVR